MPTKLVKFNKNFFFKSKWITQGILDLRVNLRTYNKILNTSINKAKSSYFHRCFENANNVMKRQWSTIIEILHKQTKKAKFPDHFVIDDKQITDQKAISNAFNNYFVNIGPNLAANIKQPNSKRKKEFFKKSNLP